MSRIWFNNFLWVWSVGCGWHIVLSRATITWFCSFRLPLTKLWKFIIDKVIEFSCCKTIIATTFRWKSIIQELLNRSLLAFFYAQTARQKVDNICAACCHIKTVMGHQVCCKNWYVIKLFNAVYILIANDIMSFWSCLRTRFQVSISSLESAWKCRKKHDETKRNETKEIASRHDRRFEMFSIMHFEAWCIKHLLTVTATYFFSFFECEMLSLVAPSLNFVDVVVGVWPMQ